MIISRLSSWFKARLHTGRAWGNQGAVETLKQPECKAIVATPENKAIIAAPNNKHRTMSKR